MTKQRLIEHLEQGDFTLQEVVDAVIEINGIIGVGLISLGDSLRDFCLSKIDKTQDKG